MLGVKQDLVAHTVGKPAKRPQNELISSKAKIGQKLPETSKLLWKPKFTILSYMLAKKLSFKVKHVGIPASSKGPYLLKHPVYCFYLFKFNDPVIIFLLCAKPEKRGDSANSMVVARCCQGSVMWAHRGADFLGLAPAGAVDLAKVLGLPLWGVWTVEGWDHGWVVIPKLWCQGLKITHLRSKIWIKPF